MSDICALTFKGAALAEEGAECDYRSGKKKGREGGGKKEQPRANRFKLPSTSHSRFQLEACLFPFWVFRGLALYARAPPECKKRGGVAGREDEKREKRGIARVDYQ